MICTVLVPAYISSTSKKRPFTTGILCGVICVFMFSNVRQDLCSESSNLSKWVATIFAFLTQLHLSSRLQPVMMLHFFRCQIKAHILRHNFTWRSRQSLIQIQGRSLAEVREIGNNSDAPIDPRGEKNLQKVGSKRRSFIVWVWYIPKIDEHPAQTVSATFCSLEGSTYCFRTITVLELESIFQ